MHKAETPTRFTPEKIHSLQTVESNMDVTKERAAYGKQAGVRKGR